MSRESDLHVDLVRTVIEAIQSDHRDAYSLLLFADLPTFGRDRPQPVRGYIPDVFAIDTPETVRIIGEAKTPTDFESERSCRQIKAFLSHLSRVEHGIFYLSVPWTYRARASLLLTSWADGIGAGHVRRIIMQ